MEEYYARDYYRLASQKTDSRVFSHLARAEQHHIEGVESAIHFLGGTPTKDRIQIQEGPKGLLAAEERCRRIENKVIKAYNDLIRTCPDPRLLPLLKRIQQANHRHLAVVGG
jgi:rubrerythrin